MPSTTILPRAVRRLIEKFERLPGVGPKSAQRLAFYLLHNPEAELQDFADRLTALKRETVICSTCHHVSDQDPCQLCSDTSRDATQLLIVEQPLDLIALERSDRYHGQYHVLHGVISPLNNIGPEQLFLHDLLGRLEGVEELIIATNPTMEGEATALYIRELVEQRMAKMNDAATRGAAEDDGDEATDTAPLVSISITRIGHGLPIGADIEYADGVTLARALEGRRKL
jgi:recombination protein RecR